ncbi:MAG: hypothetical protein M3O22_04395 [Pseudomonadota bacterium]|nr:hypothetical protein [Pseudomonadota bacterium]
MTGVNVRNGVSIPGGLMESDSGQDLCRALRGVAPEVIGVEFPPMGTAADSCGFCPALDVKIDQPYDGNFLVGLANALVKIIPAVLDHGRRKHDSLAAGWISVHAFGPDNESAFGISFSVPDLAHLDFSTLDPQGLYDLVTNFNPEPGSSVRKAIDAY